MLPKTTDFLEGRKKSEEIYKGEKYFEEGLFALSFGRLMEAAHFFYFLKEEKNSAVFFNIALCFFRAKDYQEAYLYLEKALSFLPKKLEYRFLQKNMSNLEQYEVEGNGYQEGMLYSTPIEFPSLAREQIIRLMVDVLFELGQMEEMLKKIQSLQNKNYKNIREKIKKEGNRNDI